MQRRQGLERDGRDCQRRDRARIRSSNDAADLVVYQIVNLDIPFHDNQARIVDHLHVVKDAPHDRRRSILIVIDEVGNRPAEESVRLGINLEDRKRDFVRRLNVEKLILIAPEDEAVKRRHARAVNVHPHIGFRDHDFPHRRIVGVFGFVHVDCVFLAGDCFFFKPEFIRRALKLRDRFLIVAHSYKIAHPHVGAVPANIAILD